jgi:ribosome-binding protein aMBF1 (putative translation factor)
MITGAQIKAGRDLLGWSRYQLAQRAKLHPAIIERATVSILGSETG